MSAAFSPDFINGINPGGGALDQGQMAVLAGFATALGGGAAALAGANVDGAVAAAMNEAMNNSGEHPGQKGLVGNAVDAWNALQNARSTIASLPGQFVDVVKANNGQTPPSDPNKQISDASGGNNTPPTAGAVVTPLPCPAGPGACGMAVTPVVTPGAPILASGGDGGGDSNNSAGTGSSSSSTPDSGNVWQKEPTVRGNYIESQLAKTDYSPADGWYRVGAENNGFFPLIDFQRGNTLVSVKTVDTTGSTWLPRMKNVIDELSKSNATVNGAPANMTLDIRVQPGGAAAAEQLVRYGAEQHVTVKIKVYP
ncbi:hypothetical protein [Paraburkholderia tropica]|uniref:hypothetical protein n=1 Tax=Paraburkholderia tropica TaxID=92647 RepID=UPI002ABE9185|nr:hypothetical protein [Paraburkholderia tropica]